MRSVWLPLMAYREPIASKFVILTRRKLAFCVVLYSLHLIDSEGLRTLLNCFRLQEYTTAARSAGN